MSTNRNSEWWANLEATLTAEWCIQWEIMPDPIETTAGLEYHCRMNALDYAIKRANAIYNRLYEAEQRVALL